MPKSFFDNSVIRDSAQIVGTVTQQGITFLCNTAHFVSDVTVGRLYLSEQEYQQRVDAFCNGINALPVDQLKQLTAENWVDLGAHIAADFVFAKGFGSAFMYLKEIDAMSKVQQQAAKVAKAFKKAVDTHLADNPILVTAEGVVIKMSKNMKDVGGVAKVVMSEASLLFEAFRQNFMAGLKSEIDRLKLLFAKTSLGFKEFKETHITVALDHIFGMEVIWNQKGKLSRFSGFHHDFMNSVEKNGVIKFVNKFVHENGCYRAELVIDGFRVPKKTFFPSHWSHETVVSKIYEAYDDFLKKGAVIKKECDGGKYIIDGMTQEGIKIEMYITKNGHITTAYPIIIPGV